MHIECIDIIELQWKSVFYYDKYIHNKIDYKIIDKWEPIERQCCISYFVIERQ